MSTFGLNENRFFYKTTPNLSHFKDEWSNGQNVLLKVTEHNKKTLCGIKNISSILFTCVCRALQAVRKQSCFKYKFTNFHLKNLHFIEAGLPLRQVTLAVFLLQNAELAEQKQIQANSNQHCWALQKIQANVSHIWPFSAGQLTVILFCQGPKDKGKRVLNPQRVSQMINRYF